MELYKRPQLTLNLVGCSDSAKGICRSISTRDKLIKCKDEIYFYDHNFEIQAQIPLRVDYIAKYIHDDIFYTCKNNLCIWDTNELEIVYTVKSNIHICSSLDEQCIAVGLENKIGQVDLRVGIITNAYSCKGTITAIHSKSDNIVYVGDINGNIVELDRRTTKPVAINNQKSAVQALYYKDNLISLSNNHLTLWGSDRHYSIDLTTNKPEDQDQRQVYDNINFFKSYLNYLLFPILDGNIGLFNVTTSQLHLIDGHYTKISSIEVIDKVYTHSIDGIQGIYQWFTL